MPSTSGIVSMSNARTGVISVREHAGRQVAVAAIADDRDDDRVLQLARQAQRDVHGAAGGDAGEDAFLAREAPRHFLGFGLANVFQAVDALRVVDFWQVGFGPLADAGNLRTFGRLAADDLDARVLLLEEARAAHDGAGGAHAGDEVRDPSFAVAPDLGAGGLVVHERVRRIGELVEHRAFALAHHLLGEVARRFHAALLRGQDDLGAEGAHGLAALRRQVLGHDQHHAVAARRRRHGEGDAGVARGGLDQRVAGLDAALALGVSDHGDRRPVLHRAGGIVAFELGEQNVLALGVLGAWEALQAHERRVADEVLEGLLHFACSSFTYAATPCSTVRNSPG